ncbi:SH3 domain containing GRB2 like 2a, endophilin A1 isoform X1 [Gadus macrocephalus]|uniref:SH3 domain containing GRB2 like 2a, endophilin A1 isoform X1 n=1 Tax=Gadus macrocephalus TaxID=80720 RepID=UPI0028CB89F7|nr:SH3 domain containing GRB2 like 2a, endophilin A1 isoform X1 [Gadus macrocephalus]
MSVAGLKKQFHKATQRVSEKVGGAEGTKLDYDFTEMEKKVDTTARAVMDIMTKTNEYLQPNPATRAKMSMINSMSRMRGQEKGPGYTQAETVLGDSMQKFGRELGEESNFGLALIDAGEAMRELGEVKDALDIEVKQNFIDPLQNLHDKDLKEVQHHLKKLEGRRLDFDYKKKRQGKVCEDEIKQALEKFDDSKEIAEQSMFNILEGDQIEQVSQLAALVQAQVEYHSRATEILTQVSTKIEERIRDASSKPRKEFVAKPRTSLDFTFSENHNGGIVSGAARSPGARSPGERGSTFVSIRVSLCLLLMFWSLFYIPMNPTILTYLSLLYFFSYLFLPLLTARSPGEPIVNPEGTQHLSDHLLLPSSVPWFLHSFYFLYRTISCTGLFHVQDYSHFMTISLVFHMALL